MSKLIFFFCALLLVGTACAKKVETQLEEEENSPSAAETIKNKFVAIVNDELREVEDLVQEVQRAAEKNDRKINKAAGVFKTYVSSSIINSQNKMKRNINRALKDENRSIMMECREIGNNFDELVAQALAESSYCLNNITEQTNDYFKIIRSKSDIAVKNLTDSKNEAEYCIEKNNDLSSAFKCINVVAENGNWTARKIVHDLRDYFENLTLEMSNLFPKLTLCTAVDAVLRIENDSESVVEEVRACIRMKKERARAEVKKRFT